MVVKQIALVKRNDIMMTAMDNLLGPQGPLVLPPVNPSTRPLAMRIWMTYLQAYAS